MFGLFGSPYRAEVTAEMQREIDDPEHPITRDFLQTLTRLQVNADPKWDPSVYDPADPAAAQEYWRKREDHERDLMQAAVAATAAALPQKKGRARAITGQTLSELKAHN